MILLRKLYHVQKSLNFTSGSERGVSMLTFIIVSLYFFNNLKAQMDYGNQRTMYLHFSLFVTSANPTNLYSGWFKTTAESLNCQTTMPNLKCLLTSRYTTQCYQKKQIQFESRRDKCFVSFKHKSSSCMLCIII